jgi:hypothetical protein
MVALASILLSLSTLDPSTQELCEQTSTQINVRIYLLDDFLVVSEGEGDRMSCYDPDETFRGNDDVVGVQVSDFSPCGLVNESYSDDTVENEPNFFLSVEVLVLPATSDLVFEEAFPPVEDDLSQPEVRAECPLSRTIQPVCRNILEASRWPHWVGS